jgi:hypothetical protein
VHINHGMKECPECLAEHDAYTDTCHFCNGAVSCTGHIRYLDGLLDQHGKERIEFVYCKECWIKMCDGDTAEYEEFIYRLPENITNPSPLEPTVKALQEAHNTRIEDGPS